MYTSTLKIERIDWLNKFGFGGGTTFHVASGHHLSAESGLSLANAKRARFSVFSPRLGQPPARLASQRIRTRTTGLKLSLFYGELQSQPTKNLRNY